MLITHLTWPSPNPDRLAQFYQRLGFAIRQDPGRMARKITIGHTVLHVVPGPPLTGAHHLALTIPAGALPAARALLATATELYTRDGDDQFHFAPPFGPADSIYADDPDGSLLELIARDHPHDGRGFAAARDVRGVGEVAVPVTSVPHAVDQLRRARGLDAVLDGPDFAAVGDHQGMIILVSENRVWFPTTDRRPELTPLHLVIEPVGPSLSFSNGTTLS